MNRPLSSSSRCAVVAATFVAGLCLLSTRALAHEDLDRQIAAATAELAATPDDAALLARRADLYRLHQKWEPALADYNKAARLAPELDAAIVGEAQLELDRQQAVTALAILGPFLVEHPDHGNGRLIESRALAATGDHEAAISAISSAIKHLPNPQPDHYIERAELYPLAKDGKPNPRAIAGLDEGAVRFGEQVGLHARALSMERELAMFDAALNRIERVQTRHGELISWLILRAETLTDARRDSNALAAWSKVIAAIERLPPLRQNTQAALGWREAAAKGSSRLRNRPVEPQ